VMNNQSFCGDCHRDTSLFTGRASATGPATDFDKEHPPFRVTLTRWTGDGDLEQIRAPLSDPGVAERSNLLIPHHVHLDPDGVEGPDGAEGDVDMACDDCHRQDAGGELMAPIDFEAHCNACHLLSFDLSAPDRQVPHGDPQAALDVLVDFYAQLALRGGSEEVPIEVLETAGPEQSLAWARRQAAQAASALFEDRACMQCHAVERSGSGDTLSWRIPPIHVTGNWLPAARFDHGSHAVAECTDCHRAGSSDSSDDILLPDIDTCRECHGGAAATQKLASSCVSCHEFHHPDGEKSALDVVLEHHRGVLNLHAAPDAEARGRQSRGIDPRRKRPGEEQ
ncbi:MAG: cytochrome c3 family protein, partial [Xanthomonadales bacterium]|nr:cytochrome c3 family protein [Xanthomonadales bacterium]